MTESDVDCNARPQLLCLQAEIELARGRPLEARAAVDEAVALTREQQAWLIGMRAARLQLALATTGEGVANARSALAEALGHLVDVPDSDALREARQVVASA